MKTPVNPFKQALANKQAQIGLWVGLPDAYTTEICAGAGFDWLLLDGEHAPNDLPCLVAQAQAVAGYPGTHAIARVPMGHGHVGEMLIKQYLDVGIQTLLVPMVDTATQAAALVRAMRYPQADGRGGIRGMGGARASRWGRYPQYAHEANAQVCLLVQAETRTALDNLDAIARIVKAGKAAGILTPDEALARHYLSLGATFVAVGLDTYLLARHTSALAGRFKATPAAPAPAGQTY
ncbi:MAG: aldolase/citrate lyase family protein [Rhodoferax sp.]|uniref:aldolase/citrate lyase family protein n=1 Tax=Rhodoferax sp. TaxID=50421 RepID=UPI0027264C97|nr:aldolase/citrate lyase family protein [Rhodoferax sp.]MDO8449547.1 aldolase/citrate lyase family protein [Rhodoferax sp.]